MRLLTRLRRALGRPLAVSAHRWAVLDVESSGLDARRDRLIAIAAVALHFEHGQPRIQLGDSFEVVLRRVEMTPDKANILLHGIGVGAQRAGVEPQAALRGLEHWLAASPLVAFHAAFDETLVQRAMQSVLGHRLANPWVDLGPVAAALQPKVQARNLDEWLAHFGIQCAVRHQAAADTLATAELLLKLWPAARMQLGRVDFRALQHLAAQGRWLQR
jgi:DNA polymerase III subunit epsilon